MPVPPKPPKSKPVPAGPKPFHRPGPTAPTHSRIPVHQAVAGRRFRVRDKDWAAVWGEDLSWDDAVKLKDQIVGERRSKTARVEDMEIDPPDWYVKQQEGTATIAGSPPDAVTYLPHPQRASSPSTGPYVNYESMTESQILETCGDNAARWADAFMQIQGALPISQIDAGTMIGWFANAIEAAVTARQRRKPAMPAQVTPNVSLRIPPERGGSSAPAIQASSSAAQDAQRRHEQQKERPTFTPSAPPTPPPSPLTDKVVEDLEPGELPPDDELMGEDDLAAITGEVGAMPGELDTARARVEASKHAAELEEKAKALYEGAVAAPSPPWSQLSETTKAAYRYTARYGNGAGSAS